MSIETMKQALEALENSVDLVVEDAYNAEQLYGNYPTRQGKVGGLKILAEAHKKAITALQQSIEQAQKQEPRNIRERWNIELDGDDLLVCFNDHEKSEGCRYERYVLADKSPPQRQPLTDEEILAVARDHYNPHQRPEISFARAIEAKLKGKA